jgi:hypothetical protein
MEFIKIKAVNEIHQNQLQGTKNKKSLKALNNSQPLLSYFDKFNSESNIQVQIDNKSKLPHVNAGRLFELITNFELAGAPIVNNNTLVDCTKQCKIATRKFELKVCLAPNRLSNELHTEESILFLTPNGVYFIGQKELGYIKADGIFGTRLSYNVAYDYGTKDNCYAKQLNKAIGYPLN